LSGKIEAGFGIMLSHGPCLLLHGPCYEPVLVHDNLCIFKTYYKYANGCVPYFTYVVYNGVNSDTATLRSTEIDDAGMSVECFTDNAALGLLIRIYNRLTVS